jgi:hypothetical protein
MNVIGRLLALVASAFALTAIGAAVAARAMKERIVPVDSPDAPEVTLRAIFEPISFRSNSTMFRGGTLECWFGGGLIDLRDAILDPGGARLEVRAVFGGGGRPQIQRPVTAPLLVIDGNVLFGGFGVTSVLSEQGANAVADAVARRTGRMGSAESPAAAESEAASVV